MTEELIWNMLYAEIGNAYGVAGLMGNLFAESALDPECITGKTDMNKNQYAEALNSFKYSKEDFAHDSVAFGLAQWRYWSRKQGLYEYWENYGYSRKITDVDLQIKYLLKEIKTYKTVWNTLLSATSVKEASDIVLTKYEKPANTSDSVKNKRTANGERYYNKFTKPEPQSEPEKPEETIAMLETTVPNLNVRAGNGKEYYVVTQISKAHTKLKYVAKSANGWYAVVVPTGTRVGWIDGQYLEKV